MSRRPAIELPEDCKCPITCELMKDPVIAPDGNTYERWAIEQWVRDHQTSPLTREPIPANSTFMLNRALKNVIEVLVTEIKRRELAEHRLAQAEDNLKSVLADLSSDELATVPVKIEAVIDSFHGVGLFAAPAQLFDLAELQELLQHVALGHQDEAKAMIIHNPELLKHAATITDHADRELTLTSFQLALYYRDWHMWMMIRNHIDPTDAAVQLEALEENGTPYGTHYDFSELRDAYQTYLDCYEELKQADNWPEVERLWLEVGKAQARAPLHVLQEFLRSDRSFVPLPQFDETEKPLPRAAMKLLSGRSFHDPRERIDGVVLGGGFAFLRDNTMHWRACDQFALCYGGVVAAWCLWRDVPEVAGDSMAFAKLYETRTMQYENLKVALLQAHPALRSS